MLPCKKHSYEQNQADTLFEIIISLIKSIYCNKIHTLLMEISAYPPPPYRKRPYMDYALPPNFTRKSWAPLFYDFSKISIPL